MDWKIVASVLGEDTAVNVMRFCLGDEKSLEVSQRLDSARLMAAVNGEANAEMRLKKASLAVATLRGARARLLKTAQNAAADQGKDSPAVKTYAGQLAQLDKSIAEFQAALDELTKGKAVATQMVNKIQAQVTANLIDDQITLTNKAIGVILDQAVEFETSMIKTLNAPSVGDRLRKDIKEDVSEHNDLQSSKLSILSRLHEQQDGEADEVTDEATQSALDEILGK